MMIMIPSELVTLQLRHNDSNNQRSRTVFNYPVSVATAALISLVSVALGAEVYDSLNCDISLCPQSRCITVR